MSRVASGGERWNPRQDPMTGPRYYPDQNDQWEEDHDDFAGPHYRGDPGPGKHPYRGTGGPPPPMHSPHNGYSSDQASTITASENVGPSYLLEHLATFRVAEDSDLLYPADGMRRLLHMEKTTGIWTQKMQLRLERNWVLILSHENEDIVEKFPIELIREPTAFTSDDPKELYNNIFIFVVAEDPKGNYTNSTEMHIFQCMQISAKDVVEEMKLCISGKWGALRGEGTAPPRRSHGSSRELIPPPPLERAPEPPMHNGYRGDYMRRSPVRGSSNRGGPRSDRSSMDGGHGGGGGGPPGGGSVTGGNGGGVGGPDDASSVSSESFSKDVAILNCCFDDIEKFIARLQHTAAATQELEKRRRSRKSKKKEAGDGLLSMRAKAPPEVEFVEILQKFKLSFNMLGKLRSFIHEPNAPELVHFLFTPLALIVDASRDSNYGTNLPAKVVSPLLNQDAVDLLNNCLSSRETELWQSLDDAWIQPREHWKYPVPPYQPVFSSGWAPELSDDSREHRGEPHKQHRYREDYDDFYHSKRHGQNMYSESEVSGSESASGAEGGGSSQQWMTDLRNRGARIVQVTYPRTANNDKELTVVRGEYLEVLDDSRKWWKCSNSRGQTAHVPHTIVTPHPPEEGMSNGNRNDWVTKDKGKFRYI
uniref:Epidermal growth factor receptor kinase substrate 8-like protein 2 n=2 Tax=Hirondellea gigas TaxID=1518452 RepID=A0A6A7FVU1_9CRUS